MLVIQSKKLTITQKLMKLKRKLLIIIMINILLLQNLMSLLQKLKQANIASKSDIANFINKTDFDNKLRNFTSNKNELN